MFTKDEQNKLMALMNTNEDFAYFITKTNNNCKLLTSQISHELRNPLTLIKSTAQLIESNNPEVKDFKHWTQLMEDINGLVDLLMELSLFNNSSTISKQDQDFLLLIKSVIDAFTPQTEQNGIDLTFSVKEEEISYFIKYPFDKIKFKQVLTNLIRNAFEATKSGDYINVECALSLPNYLTIAVHNNGDMIPPEDISTIFEPFVTYKSGGSGLGLAISSNIVNAHNGTLQVTSSEKKTSFTIQLPITN